MRIFHYYKGPSEPDGISTITEEEILTDYFEYWSKVMKTLGREHLISKENCVLDWCVTNWAWEVPTNSE